MAIRHFCEARRHQGRVARHKHKDEIEVLSCSWGVTNAGSMAHGSGGGEGKARFHDLSFMHNVDKASPVLMQACATGAHIKEATITHRKAGKGQQEYLDRQDERRHHHRRARTAAAAATTADGERQPARSPRSTLEYKPQKPDGSLDAGIHFKYDLKANKEG